MKNNIKKIGFTLIEVLVVIAIIGLLASITLVALKEVRKKAYVVRALNYGAQVHHAIGAYLVAEYKFDGIDNDYSDTSGNGYDGTPVGNPQFTTDVVPEIGGKAMEFDGNDYIDIGVIPALAGENITIIAWIKWAGHTGSYNPILTQYDGTGRGYYFYLTQNDELGLWIFGGEALISPPAGFGDEWHFVAGTYDGVQLAVYIDGVLKGVLDREDTGVDEPAYIASALEGAAGREYFNGSIDELRIYEEVFTSTQIKKLYVEEAEKRELLAKEQ